MDAGSSQTLLFAYKWFEERSDNFTGILTEVNRCKISGGIATLPFDSVMGSIIRNYLDKCFNNIMTSISTSISSSSSSQSVVPVYFASTAGMRLLNLTSPGKASSILAAVEKYISNFTLSSKQDDIVLTASPDLVTIISGAYEGYYAWITANYLVGSLNPHHKKCLFSWHSNVKFQNLPITEKEMDTSAIIDLGGSSTQISFQVDFEVDLPTKGVSNDTNDPSIINESIFGVNHSVITQSNLCFGMDQARLRHQFLLMQQQALVNFSQLTLIDSNIVDPCMPTNSRFLVSSDELMNNPCLMEAEDASKWKEITPGVVYPFAGSYDERKCNRMIEILMSWNECKGMFAKCFKFDPSQAMVTKSRKIFAISGFYSVAMVLSLDQESSISKAVYDEETKKLCSMDLNDVIHFSPKLDKDYVDQYCFQLKYVQKILSGYQIKNDKFSDIVFTTKINKQSIGWTQGLAMNSIRYRPAIKKIRPISETSHTVIIITAITLIAIGLVIIFKTRYQERK